MLCISLCTPANVTQLCHSDQASETLVTAQWVDRGVQSQNSQLCDLKKIASVVLIPEQEIVNEKQTKNPKYAQEAAWCGGNGIRIDQPRLWPYSTSRASPSLALSPSNSMRMIKYQSLLSNTFLIFKVRIIASIYITGSQDEMRGRGKTPRKETGVLHTFCLHLFPHLKERHISSTV